MTAVDLAYDDTGDGPVVVFIDGATCTRNHSNKPELTRIVAEHFAVVSYDRRGRGESGDTLPYGVAREIEDIAAVMADARSSGRSTASRAPRISALHLRTPSRSFRSRRASRSDLDRCRRVPAWNCRRPRFAT